MAEPPQRRMAAEPRRLEIGEIGLAMNRDRPQLRRGTRAQALELLPKLTHIVRPIGDQRQRERLHAIAQQAPQRQPRIR